MKFQFQKIKPTKTWLVLGIAMGVGLLAALAARSFLASQMDAIENRNKGTQINLVVAKRELKRGDLLTRDTVSIRSVPVDYAHSLALQPSELDRFDGKPLAHPVKPGELILWSMLEGKKVPTFSARVETGHRAITVPVDEINSISGLLEPGDLIDLMVTVDQKGKKFTVPLLQVVRVMATGQRSVDDPKSGERRQYSTVTLDATPEQAQNVIVAREAGKITALLRNPGDKQQFRGGNSDLASLLGLKGDVLASKDNGTVRQVPVLYGGRGAQLPPEGLQLGQYVRSNAVAVVATSESADAMRELQSLPATVAPPPGLSNRTAVSAVSAQSPVRVLTDTTLRQP